MPVRRKYRSLCCFREARIPDCLQPAAIGALSTNNYVCMTNCAQQGNRTPLYDYADTISWTKESMPSRPA